MQSLPNDQHLAVALNISVHVASDNTKYYTLQSQWTDNDSWNPTSKTTDTTIGINPADLLLNIITVIELTYCNRILIHVHNDEVLKENLKVLSNQSVSKTKTKALKEICFNTKEQTKLNSMFRVNNIEVI